MLRRHRRRALGLLLAAALLTPALTGCGSTQTFEVLQLERSGNDDASPAFTVNGPWTLRYSYDCSGQGSTQGLVISVINDSDDTLIAEDPDIVDAHAAAGKRTTSDHVISYRATTGTLHLQVQSGCGWRIQVRETQ